MQIGVSFGLWSFISFGFFWVVDVLDSVRLNRGGKVHLESGVCGCRVGFNGERIHFGSSGCRSVGGNKNRGIIDYSFDHALSMTIEFAQEIHDLAPGLMRDFVCTVCSGVRNIVRVSLGLSIVSLAYLAVKLIEMCAFLSRILHALDKCPVLSCTLLGAIAEYFGKEKHASIVGGIVLLKYPLHVIYILYFSLCLGRVILKRTLIQWPLALVKSLTSFVRSGGQNEQNEQNEQIEQEEVVQIEQSGETWTEITLKLPSMVDGVMKFKAVRVGTEVGSGVTVGELQRFCCALLPEVRCSSQIRLVSGGRLLADPESILEFKSGQVVYCSLELHGGMFGRGPPPAWDISPPGRRYDARDFGTPGITDEQARRAREEREQGDAPAGQGRGEQESPSADRMLDMLAAKMSDLGNALKSELREENRKSLEILRRESGITFQPMNEQQKGPVRLSLMEQRELGTVPSNLDTEPSVVKGMDLYLGNKADPPSEMPCLKEVPKLEERLVAISAWLVAFERYVKSSLSVTDVADGHDLQEASEELWNLIMQGITDWTSAWITREGSLKQGLFTLKCAWDGGNKGKAYTKWAFRVCNTVVATLGNLQANFNSETAFLRLSPMQQIFATPIYLLKVHGIKKASDITDLVRKIDNPGGWIVNRDGKEFEERLRRWAALSEAFDRLVPPILQQAGGERAPNRTNLLDSLRLVVNSWLKVISENHKSELNKICDEVSLFQPFETTEDAAEKVTNAILALASVSSELKKIKAPPQSKGKGDAHGYFAGKGQGKGKDGKKGGKSKGDAGGDGKGQQQQQQQKKLYCWDFQQGKCNRGENCNFLHEIDKRPLCWNFQSGHCKDGWKCRFRHAREGSGNSGGKGAEAPAKNQ